MNAVNLHMGKKMNGIFVIIIINLILVLLPGVLPRRKEMG